MRALESTRRRLVAVAALALALVTLAPAARADDPIKSEERRTSTLAAAFGPLAGLVAPSVVEVRTVGGDDLGFAVAIEDGRTLLTSRSILAAAGGTTVSIRSSVGEVGTATIAGKNEAYDVAVLTLTAKLSRLVPLAFGGSKALSVGQWVISVGTVPGRPLAVGVVSALGRRVEAHGGEESQALDLFGLFNDNAGPRRSYARVIQHDGPIDGDKHGSPLVDADGRLVGVNVANAYRGSSYAAPIDDVREFLADLKAGKPGPDMPRPGFLGVAVGAIADPAIAKAREIAGTGVEIREVQKGGAADTAGLKPGDVVLAVAGEKVRSLERFGLLVRGKTPGETLALRVLRGGKDEIDVRVIVAGRPAGEE